MFIISALLLSLSGNIDCLALGINYGLQNIEISKKECLIITIINTVGTLLAMWIGLFFNAIISSNIANLLGAISLVIIGIVTLIKAKKESTPEFDKDHSGKIDMKEAIFLGMFLMINNLILGFSGSITGVPILATTLFTFLFSYGLLFYGIRIGNKCHTALQKFAPYFGGILLITLGIIEYFI